MKSPPGIVVNINALRPRAAVVAPVPHDVSTASRQPRWRQAQRAPIVSVGAALVAEVTAILPLRYRVNSPWLVMIERLSVPPCSYCIVLARRLRVAPTVDRGHGRIEQRTRAARAALAGVNAWPGLAQVSLLERQVTSQKTGQERHEWSIDINGKRYVLGRRLVGRYVTATIFTHRRTLVVKVGARRYKRFPLPIPEPLVAAIVPLPRGWS